MDMETLVTNYQENQRKALETRESEARAANLANQASLLLAFQDAMGIGLIHALTPMLVHEEPNPLSPDMEMRFNWRGNHLKLCLTNGRGQNIFNLYERKPAQAFEVPDEEEGEGFCWHIMGRVQRPEDLLHFLAQTKGVPF